ncbi:LysE family translocator [Teredinibacter purpureus]|uniref:LysE family translocator n=1 Tax=Teredinibacter purpureus TaxID=2731756 RepID=UPI000A42A6F3|nr:LysE family translocator [Teredinibacter purpureus]
MSILLFSLSTSATPGPNTVMLLSSAASYGVKRSIPAYLGVCIGFSLMLSAVALGFGSVFVEYPWLHQVIKAAGVSYLLFLAWKIANLGEMKEASGRDKPITFFQAAAFQWVNPKALIIAVGSIAAYTTPGEQAGIQALAIVVVMSLMGLITMGLWMLFGAGMHRFIRSPKAARRFNFLMATLLVLSIFPILSAELII